MHENDVLDAFIVVFVRALDKQTSNHRPKDQRTHAKNLQPTLHSLGRFLGKSLNLREFKTISSGGNHCRSRHFPFLKPTHSVIPYQDFVQLVCKKRQSTIPFCTRITVVLVQPFACLLCLLFALSTLGSCNQRRNEFFLPKRKIALFSARTPARPLRPKTFVLFLHTQLQYQRQRGKKWRQKEKPQQGTRFKQRSRHFSFAFLLAKIKTGKPKRAH